MRTMTLAHAREELLRRKTTGAKGGETKRDEVAAQQMQERRQHLSARCEQVTHQPSPHRNGSFCAVIIIQFLRLKI